MGINYNALDKTAQEMIIHAIGQKQSKYGNHKTVIDGHTFDSKREARRYAELRLLEKAGEITDLRLQVPFELIPPQKKRDGKVERGCKYIADFVYYRRGICVVEDAKGDRTDVYVIKRKLMLQKYGIEVEEV